MKKALALLALAWAVGASAEPSNVLRIGLKEKVPEVTVGPGDYRVSGDVSIRKWRFTKAETVTLGSEGLRVGKRTWGTTVTIAPRRKEGVVALGARSYRGAVELSRVNGGIRVVNLVPIEDYLRGVLHLETSNDWPEQALRAQAVISRTYALYHRGRHAPSGYDLCDAPHCQVYGGASAERSNTDAAVRRTRGEVLVDRRNNLISTVFHSSCGGSTEAAENVWENGGQPYLQAIRCPWCKNNPHAMWVADLTGAEVDRGIQKAGFNMGHVRAIGVLSHSPSGRAHMLRLFGDRGTRDLLANKFRVAVGPDKIRSTFWSGISRQGSGWRIHGRGWGHGVGLCQWGMKELATKKFSYGQILRMYYKGVEVADWKK